MPARVPGSAPPPASVPSPPSVEPPPAWSDLTVGVIHHRVPRILRECLVRLARYAPGVPVVVVDTAPDPATRRWVEAGVAGAPGARWLACPNHSLAYAVDRFLDGVETPFAAHLNADVYLGPDGFAPLLEPFANPAVAMVGPTCVTPAGVPQAMGPRYRLNHLRLALSGRPTTDVGWLSGCFQVVRMEAVRGPRGVGGMDGSLRFYNEDLEWCARLRAADWRLRLARSRALHLGGSSTPRRAIFRIEGHRGGMVLTRRTRGRAWRRLHRAVVRAEAALRRRDPDPQVRHAYRAIGRMFRLERYDVSPFGPTLDAVDPRFTEAIGLPPNPVQDE